jgi:hypothetical protein
VEGINESLIEDNLQKGKIISFPFLNGYTEVLCKTENHSFPKHFVCGPRKLDIILIQLRSSASFFNFDLFRVGIVSDPSCRCGGRG